MDEAKAEEYAKEYQAALVEPMQWFHLDSDFLDDPKIMRLGCEYGWPYIGLYVGLMSRLYTQESHIIDVSTDYGWLVLQHRMSLIGNSIGIDSLKSIVDTLAELGLIDSDMYSESGKIASDRVFREAENYAEKTAKNRCAGKRLAAGRKRKSAGQDDDAL